MEQKSKKAIPYNANGLRLSAKELLAVAAAVMVAVLVVLPFWHSRSLKVELPDHFRFSYAYRDDYYLYGHVVKAAAAKYDALFLGDSVIWGMYVNNESTLTECLNRRAGRESYGNIAIDGLHPVAMRTLVKEHGRALAGKQVFLAFNPLWVNTPEYDLTGKGDIAVNHPKLLPLFDPTIKANKQSLSERCNALLERKFAFYGMLHHLQLVCFGNKDLKSFIAQNPGTNPLARLHSTVNPLEQAHALNSKIDWYDAGLPDQDWPWVMPDASRQWQAFLETIELLKARGNQVTVLLGAINAHMLTPKSAAAYEALRAEHIRILASKEIPTIFMPVLPSNEYGDASHPLAPGYERLADYLAQQIQRGDSK